MVIRLLLFMLPNLHVELVYQRINGGVHVFVNGLCKQFGTGDVDGRFGPVAKLFDLEHNMGVGDIVEMPLDPPILLSTYSRIAGVTST